MVSTDKNTDTPKEHWGETIAQKVISVFPDNAVYTCAAGISPSGIVHFGNFRDVITSFVVSEKLKQAGKKTRLIFSWDDFDRFRKVPDGVDPSFEQYLGMPLTSVPCPDGAHESYARKFEVEFEEAMRTLGIELEYISQTKEYQSGRYDEAIKYSLQKRGEIADILLSFMTEKGKSNKNIVPEEYKERYYPVSLYSRFSGKDNTKIISYDGEYSITYKCFDTEKEETIDFRKDHIVKLAWKIDWPMRWREEGVVFEPGGHDHASPGGSFDVASTISKKIFEATPPVFQEYLFVGIQGLGAKMSGSKGNAISPAMLLDIYTPSLLKWTYINRRPEQTFQLAFNEEIYKQYSEFDKNVEGFDKDVLEEWEKNALLLSGVAVGKKLPPIPFRQAVSFGQIVQWDDKKIHAILEGLDFAYDDTSIKERMEKARAWLLRYNPDEIVSLLDAQNTEYISSMDAGRIEQVRALRGVLEKEDDISIKEIEALVYDLPKNGELSLDENKPLQRAFFKDVYNLLIARDAGPRLSTFLWAVDRKKVLSLLDV